MGNGRVSKSKGSAQTLYYKEYRLLKKHGNVLPTAQIGDELKGRGDGTFENGELGHWEVIKDNPLNDNDVKFLVSYP